MLETLGAVCGELSRRAVPHALIGAAAMAARGVVRSTDDLDLLVTDHATLQLGFWQALADQGHSIEVRLGDDGDPLAGVVRVSTPPARAIDVVVGRHAWQRELIARAEPHDLGPVRLPVASTADLILLKLYAGGARDLQDVTSLLELGDRRAVEAAVGQRIDRLPDDARRAWRNLTHGPGSPR